MANIGNGHQFRIEIGAAHGGYGVDVKNVGLFAAQNKGRNMNGFPKF